VSEHTEGTPDIGIHLGKRTRWFGPANTDGGLLAALGHHSQRAMTAVDVQVVGVGAERFADRQAVHGQQADEGVSAPRAEAGLDEEGAELVAVHAQRPGLGVDLGAADVGAGSRARSPSRWQ
jgi:hypothetical protein